MKLISAIALLVLSVSTLGAAEVRTAQVLAPWQGEGEMFIVAKDRARFLGALEGTMYVQTGYKGEIDDLPYICPTTHYINLENMTVVTEGQCIIGRGENVIFATYECTGPLNGCEGIFYFKGGTGDFNGMTGASKMNSRTKIKGILLEKGTLVATRQAVGLMTLPELVYRIPEK